MPFIELDVPDAEKQTVLELAKSAYLKFAGSRISCAQEMPVVAMYIVTAAYAELALCNYSDQIAVRSIEVLPSGYGYAVFVFDRNFSVKDADASFAADDKPMLSELPKNSLYGFSVESNQPFFVKAYRRK